MIYLIDQIVQSDIIHAQQITNNFEYDIQSYW